MKARVSLLHRTEAEWDKLDIFIPEAGELIVYDPDDTYDYARAKMGDGETLLQDLPFFIDSAVANVLSATRYLEVLDGGRISDYV